MAEPPCTSRAPEVDDENTMTLDEVLEEELQLENDANAVLGPSDDKNCSYDKGYIPRQALYSCKTCKKGSHGEAGICLACSYHCHEGHDLVELYTKRFFRCDCGNKKFGELKCNLAPNKEAENEANIYNQNFQGLYCVCSRPYPDPEDEVSDDMIQCCICEDWYHSRHLNTETPGEENYAEMICESCTKRLGFLQYYSGLIVSKVGKPQGPSEGSVDVVSVPAEDAAKTTEETIADTPTGTKSDKAVECKIKAGKQNDFKAGATFWPNNFRSLLCTCPECKEMYADLKVSWITDENDTVQAYEEKGKTVGENGSKPSQYEQGMKALSELNRVQQIEAILNYNDLKSNLKTYLAKFAETKKVVREEDIREFFSQMQARKRQKLDDGTPPYACH
uniref:Putative E3 ubiquitin-protein ligase UBR7 n=1 Tax=Lygus hesperus TaxID=30085 RepID=A0A0A9XU37_LYGHE